MGWILIGLLAAAVLIVVVLALIGMAAIRRERKAASAEGSSGSSPSKPAASIEPDAVLEPVSAPVPAIAEVAFSPQPQAEGGISQEIVAVIAAAIAALAPEGTRYAIRQISRLPQGRMGRSAWSMAGLLQNTRPF